MVPIADLLDEKLVAWRLHGDTKEAVIAELVDLVAAAGLARNRDEALGTVLARERTVSTGLENGVAIPHGKTDAVNRLVVALGLKPEGLDFASLDAQPSRIFVLTLSPLADTGPHIQFLATMSKLLRRADVRDALLTAPDAAAVIAGLLTAAAAVKR